MREEIYYHQWLQSMRNLTARNAQKLLKTFPEAQEILKAPQKRLEEMLPPAQYQELSESRQRVGNVSGMREQYEKLWEKGIRFVSFQEDAYPGRLLEIPDPPVGLYYKGRLPGKDALSVSIIGSRDCSEYGSFVARELGGFLGGRGIDVISGMARGIDGISQQAALEAGGASYGVLGCGVDVCYPSSNRRLYDSLSAHGGILSTYPIGTPAAGRNFPARNRIVSGMADALVVVEARVKSGTLITVDMALEQGREVYVVPGRVTDRLSDGCNRLIKQGAGVFLDPETFLEELEELSFLKKTVPSGSGSDRDRREGRSQTTKPLKKQGTNNQRTNDNGMDNQPALQDWEEELVPLWEKLDHTPKSMEEIGRSLGDRYSAAELGVLLMRLVMTGRVKQVTTGYFCRQR